MKLRALIITSARIERYLTWLGKPTERPTRALARGPCPSSTTTSSAKPAPSSAR
jgi:hypothetical protein